MSDAQDIDAAIRRVLEQGEFGRLRVVPQGSNATYETTLALDGADPVRAIYKPAGGEAPLWDFPPASLYKREYAAYFLSEILEWNIVPLTLVREGPQGIGTVQLFVDHDPRDNFFTIREQHPSEFKRMAAYDLLINNADRKASHCLRDSSGRIWSIDHGVVLHDELKLRTVIWDYAGEPVPEEVVEGLVRLERLFAEQDPLVQPLDDLLHPAEQRALHQRLLAILRKPVFPFMDSSRRWYPWPME